MFLTLVQLLLETVLSNQIFGLLVIFIKMSSSSSVVAVGLSPLWVVLPNFSIYTNDSSRMRAVE
jgi:hypothetical protein